MIVTNRHENSVLGKMEGSNFTFYLTGSRFFGGYTSGSDWDYFVKDSDEVRNFLDNLGFYLDDNPAIAYDDTTVVSVFKYADIHVQLVNNPEFKAKAQDLLSNNIMMRNVPKIARKYLWNFAIAFLNSNMKLQEMIESRREEMNRVMTLANKTYLSGK